MGRAFVKEGRRGDRGQDTRTAAPIAPRSSAAAGTTVALLVAHPADALAVTGPELGRMLEDPGHRVVVVCLAPGDAGERGALLSALGGGESWQERTERLPSGAQLRTHSSTAVPRAEVCFVEHGHPLSPGAPDGLVGCVLDVLNRFSPRLLCTLDPDPEHVGRNEQGGPVHADHPEHTAVAEAVLEAVRVRPARGLSQPLVVECFRAVGPCEDGAAPRAAVARYPGRRVWLTRGTDGRLTAYAALDGGLVRWTESSAGDSEWSERELLPGPALLPYLSVAQSPAGWVHLVALQRTVTSSGATSVEIMHAIQYQSGRPITSWRSIGNPNSGDLAKGREMGVPSVLVDGGGCVHVYARNFGLGVSSRIQQADGTWGPWTDIKGSRVSDGLAPVLTAEGEPELFAASADGVLRWRRVSGKGALQQVPGRLPMGTEPGSALTALATGPGRTTVYGCAPRDGTVSAHRTDGAATSVGGAGGQGVTAVRADIGGYDCTVLLQRSADGSVAIGAYPTEHESAGLWWERTGGQGVREPAAAVDADGRLVVASIGTDGLLHVARQDMTAQGLLLGGWKAV